jgi:hypothetical protein
MLKSFFPEMDWMAKTEILKSNLNFLIEYQKMNLQDILNDVRALSSAIVRKEDLPVLYQGTDYQATFEEIGQLMQKAISQSPGTLVMIAMYNDLIKAGQYKLEDLLEYLRDSTH